MALTIVSDNADKEPLFVALIRCHHPHPRPGSRCHRFPLAKARMRNLQKAQAARTGPCFQEARLSARSLKTVISRSWNRCERLKPPSPPQSSPFEHNDRFCPVDPSRRLEEASALAHAFEVKNNDPALSVSGNIFKVIRAGHHGFVAEPTKSDTRPLLLAHW